MEYQASDKVNEKYCSLTISPSKDEQIVLKWIFYFKVKKRVNAKRNS